MSAPSRRVDHDRVHVSRSTPAADYLEFAEPFGIGPVIEIDTTRPVDMGEAAGRVRQAFGSQS